MALPPSENAAAKAVGGLSQQHINSIPSLDDINIHAMDGMHSLIPEQNQKMQQQDFAQMQREQKKLLELQKQSVWWVKPEEVDRYLLMFNHFDQQGQGSLETSQVQAAF